MPHTPTTGTPTMDEVSSFIHNHAVPKAIRTLDNLSFIEAPEEYSLVIGRNTSHHSTIQLRPDGHIDLSENTGHTKLKQFRPRHLSLFAKAHDAISFQAQTHVLQEIQTFLNLTSTNQKQHHHNPRVRSLIQTYQSDEFRKELTKAVTTVTNALTSGYIADPSRLGYSKLYNLIGKDRVSHAFHVAGSSVLLHQLNTINSHKQAIDQAHRSNPNATVTWFTTLCPSDTGPDHLTADDIIQEACAWFKNKCLRAGFTSTQELWNTFTHLNASAVRQYPPHTDDEAYPTLCQFVLETGVPATYSAVKNLVKDSYILTNDPGDLRDYLIRSRNRADHPGTEEPQHKLWENFLQAHNPLYAVSHSKDLPKREPKPTTPAAPRKKTASKQQLAAIINTPVVLALIREASESIILDSTPGHGLTLAVRDQHQPLLFIQKEPDGYITIQSHGYWTGGCTIPHPHAPKEREHGWNTRGLIQGATLKAVHNFIKQNWNQLSPAPELRRPSRNQVAYAIRNIPNDRTSHDPPPTETDQSLSDRMEQTLRSLADPEVWNITNQLSLQVTPALYNMAATLHPHIPHLNQTNPGALVWAFSQTEPTERLNHPGQLITLVRHSMTTHGLDESNWKFAATLNHVVIDTITRDVSPAHATLLLNAIAKNRASSGTAPNTTVLRHIVTELIPDILDHEDSPQHPATTTDNTQAMIALMCAESRNIASSPASRGQHALLNETQDVKDYVKAMNLQSLPIRSTTWNGILQASDRWHRQLRTEEIQYRWRTTIELRQGWYYAWSSAMGETNIGEYTITPLTDEKQLLEESTHMDHCVFDYASTCARGGSRIFSIALRGRKVATCQLRQDQHGDWKIAQTRGPHNDPVSDDINKLTAQIPRLYEQASNSREPGNSTYWYINENTGQTAPTIPGHTELFENDLPF